MEPITAALEEAPLPSSPRPVLAVSMPQTVATARAKTGTDYSGPEAA